MSRLHFQSRIDLSSAEPGTESQSWKLTFKLVDNEGKFRARDVTETDVLVLDTGAVETGTLTRYTITHVVNTTWDGNVEVIAEYDDDNDNQYPNPNLGYVIGYPGIITRPFPSVGLLPLSSAETQKVSDRFGFYLQNYNSWVTDQELKKTSVGIVTAENILPDGDGYYVLPQIPLGDLVWKMAIANLADGSAAEMVGVDWGYNSSGSAQLILDPDDVAWLHSPIVSITVSFLGYLNI